MDASPGHAAGPNVGLDLAATLWHLARAGSFLDASVYRVTCQESEHHGH